MPGKAAKITITERQKEILDEFSRSRSEPSFLTQRSTIILLAFTGLLNEQIALQVDLERHQVGIWRSRWAEALRPPGPCRVYGRPACSAKGHSRTACRLPSPGLSWQVHCRTIGPDLRGCLHQAGRLRPSRHPLDPCGPRLHEVAKRGIVTSISVRHLGRLLDEADLKPHRIRYWLNAKQKDDPTFAIQVQLICATYGEGGGVVREVSHAHHQH